MNIVPVNIASSRCSGRSANSNTAIQTVLASNVGKIVTLYTTGMCQDTGGFTGLLSSIGGGAVSLVTTRASSGGCGCGCGCSGITPLAQTRARNSRTTSVSLVIPICHITAVSLPNT